MKSKDAQRNLEISFLETTLSSLKKNKSEPSEDKSLIEKAFERHLFPDTLEDGEDERDKPEKWL